MAVCAEAEIVIAKLLSLGCKRREDQDDDLSLYFSVLYREREWELEIPRPLEDGGYTQRQLDVIENQLARFGLDLLPLDRHLQ